MPVERQSRHGRREPLPKQIAKGANASGGCVKVARRCLAGDTQADD